MALTNVWLIQEYLDDELNIENNDVVLDIGGHIGLFALFASQFCKKGKIFCFEPIKENYNILLENIELNTVKNIIPFNLAVYNDSKRVKMYLNEDDAGHSIILPSSKSIQTDSISLKKIFDDNKIDLCDFAKIDCEGSEYSIIDALPSEYLKRINKMAIEYHFADSKPELARDLISKIENAGFHVKKKSHYNDMGFLYVRR
jgi:FkbM family methyltransferase